MEESNKVHLITLTQRVNNDEQSHTSGFSFRSLKQDFSTLYHNFTLLSYFTSQCRIVINDRFKFDKDPAVQIDEFFIDYTDEGGQQKKVDTRTFYLFQKTRDFFKGTQDLKSVKLYIQYTIGTTLDQIAQGNSVTVQFQTEKTVNRQYIHIKIIDNDGWIQDQFQKVIDQTTFNRVSQRRKMGENQLQYCYIEPRSTRNKKIDQKHFSIALQGGGVKGVAYIGAYKALMKEYPQIPIKSIIGSSAGGMLGLAICCQMTEKQIIELCEKQLSTITQDKRYEDNDAVKNQQQVKKYMNILKDFLTEFGIVNNDIVNLIQQVLEDPQFSKATLKLIKAFNPQIMKLFSVGPNEDKLGVRGLLEGALMSGNAIRKFAQTCLKSLRKTSSVQQYEEWQRFIGKQRTSMRDKSLKIKPQLSIDQWTQTLTMSQLYEITGIQFTCTSVDVDSHVLRFFNHKTTPNLPVCKAVQMTGSFPVAFESQHWKQQWGKYRIHYDNCRRQIDLSSYIVQNGVKKQTGHHFTDGGVLANFPIKYLDNEYMRPMYFSHAKIDKETDPANHTIIYGFGLNAVKPAVDLSKQIKEFSNSMTNVLNNKIGFMRKMKYAANAAMQKVSGSNYKTITDTSKDINNPVLILKKIPVIDFIIKLLNTYVKTKDNLTEECFAHRVYETEVGKQYSTMILENYQIKNIKENIIGFQNSFKTILMNQLQKDNSTEDKQGVLKQIQTNINYMINGLNNKYEYSQQIISKVAIILKSSLANLSVTQLILSQKQNASIYQLSGSIRQYFRQEIMDIDLMMRCKMFEYSGVKKDHLKLIEILRKIQDWLQKQYKVKGVKLLEFLWVIRKDQFEKIQRVYEQYSTYVDQIKKDTGIYQTPMEPELVFNIIQIKKWCLTCSLEKNIEFQKILRQSKIPQLIVSEEAFNKQAYIQSYVTQLIEEGQKRVQKKSQKATGIHIVLESIQFSELYFHQYFSAVKNAILNYNLERRKQFKGHHDYQDIKITSMTASNFHSLVMFLHACNIPAVQVNKDVWRLNDLIKQSPILNPQKIKDEDWKQFAHSNSMRMKNIEQKTWEQRFNIYGRTQEILNKNYNGKQLEESIADLKFNAGNSIDQINQAIQNSLNYVVDQLLTLDTNELKTEEINKVCQKLIIDFNGQNTEKAEIQKQKKSVYLLKMFGQRYLDLIKFFFYSSTYIIEQIVSIQYEEYRKEAWKALLTAGILHTMEIKKFVCEKFVQIGLKPNTTLSQFYDLSQKKILLNFAVIESENKIIKFYNKKTRPNMPVWAAIMASCALPDFFKPIPDRNQWKYTADQYQSDRITKEYFSDKVKSYNYLSSAQIITKLPLQLLTNEKLKKKITDTPRQIYLAFNFSDIQFKSINTKMVQNIKSFAFNPLALNSESKNLAFIGTLFGLAGLQSITSRYDTYGSTHDNLITGLYKNQLAKLPIRVQTLDFDKIMEGNHISPQIKDAIMQCEYVIKEKIYNSNPQEKQKDHCMYFAIENDPKDLQNLIFRHLSALNPTRSLFEKYKFFYSLNSQDNFIEFQGQKLTFKLNDPANAILNMKFIYPEKQINEASIKRLYHHVDLKNIVQYKQLQPKQNFCLVYFLKFNKFHQENQDRIPEFPQNSKIIINYKSFLKADSIPNRQLICNNCNNSNEWQIIKGSQSLKLKDQKCFNSHCPSTCQDYLVRLVYRCRCKVVYCAYCKFETYIDETSQLVCPLKHKLNKVNDYELHKQNPPAFIQCDLCQGFNSPYFMEDKKCDINLCESCTILHLFKKK